MNGSMIGRLSVCASLALCAHVGADETLPFLTVDAKGFLGASIRDLALSDDGHWLAAAGEKHVRIWDLRSNTVHAVLRGFQLEAGLKLGRANAVCFSPGNDPKYLVVGISDNTRLGSTRVYQMDDLSKFRLLEGHTACTDRVAFSRDGNYLASWG
jgi:WD40 repeat protein